MLNTASPHWHPAPAIRFSFFLHAGAIVLCIAKPDLWLWALAAVLINHLALFAAVFWPTGRVLGPNVVRLPPSARERGEICLTFDDGPDPVVTPQVLDLLDRYQAKASFFCIAEKAAKYPHVVQEIIRRGHSVENHSYRHPYTFALYGLTRLRREVESAQRVIAEIAGHAPAFFRAPVGFRSPLLDPVLAKLGLRYVSWTRRALDGVQGDAERALQRLIRGLAAGDILLMHDGARVQTKTSEPVVMVVLPKLLEHIKTCGLKVVSLPLALESRRTTTVNSEQQSLYHAAADCFIDAGKFPWHFARGKLRRDPIYFALLKQGLLPDQGRLLDLGCGQGILLALLAAARKQFETGAWPKDWPAPPLKLAMQGIELREDSVRTAQRVLEDGITVEQGDLRQASLTPCSVVVILDVLHYLDEASQRKLLERVAASLEAGGVLLVREGNAAAGISFQITQWAERIAGIAHGHLWLPMHYRSTAQWIGLLEDLGFAVTTQPMSEGTPFSNVLLIARR